MVMYGIDPFVKFIEKSAVSYSCASCSLFLVHVSDQLIEVGGFVLSEEE